MNVVRLSPRLLEMLHLYYFGTGIISLFLFAISLFYSSVSTTEFLIFYLIHSFFSWGLSAYLYKNMERFFVIYRPWRYFFTFFLSLLLFLVFYYVTSPLFFQGVIVINYFVSVLAITWYVLFRAGVLQRFFLFYTFHDVEEKKKQVLNHITELSMDADHRAELESLLEEYEGGNTQVDASLLRDEGRQAVREVVMAKRDQLERRRSRMTTIFQDTKTAFYDDRIAELNAIIAEIDKNEQFPSSDG